MISIPEELLEQVEKGNVLLFIGEGIVRDEVGHVELDQLAALLAARSGITAGEENLFPRVAQAYEDQMGRYALVRFGGGVMSNDVVSFQVSFHEKGLTPWILSPSLVGIVEVITLFAMVSLQMANRNIFAAHVANRVVPILVVMRILRNEETRSCAHMKSAAVCAVLSVRLACLVTLSALGLKKSISPPCFEDNTCTS